MFTSDSRVQAKGFHASYTFIFPTTTTTTTTTTTIATTRSSTAKRPTRPPQKTTINVTVENTTSHNRSTDDLPRAEVDSTNASVSMHLAMISYDKADDDVKLTAVFVEPPADDNADESANKTISNTGKTSKYMYSLTVLLDETSFRECQQQK